MESSLNFQGFMGRAGEDLTAISGLQVRLFRANNSIVDGWTFGLDDVFTKTKVQG
jgi:hypothetical protein